MSANGYTSAISIYSIMESIAAITPGAERNHAAIAALARTWLATDGPRRAVSGAGDVLRHNARRFPPPWTAEETDACFIVRDRDGRMLALFARRGYP